MQKSAIERDVRELADRAHRQEGQNVYVLVDGALQQSALKRTKAFARPHSIVPVDGVVARSDLAALPFLVELTSPELRHSDALMADLSTWALDNSAVTWLTSKLSVSSLAEQLALRMEAQLEQSMFVMLRFADARVLPVLYDTLDAKQRSEFFSCVTSWWYVSRRGEVQRLPLAQEPGIQLPSFQPPLRLTEPQERRLLDAAEPDSVMQILRRHDAEKLDQLDPSERYDFIKACIERAKTWSIEAPSDLALFCMVALEHGPAFDELPQWRAPLTQLRGGENTLLRIVQHQAIQT